MSADLALPVRQDMALARREAPAPAVRVDTDVELFTLCGALAKSGYFKDARDASQAVVKVLYGCELGVGPVTAMMSIHVIEGKPAPSANLLAAMVKRSGVYDYRVAERSNTRCELVAFERGQEVGRLEWTMEDAQRAGLAGRGTWKNYPRQMLFNRCMSEMVRTYFPDLFGGAPVYTPEELGADTDASGEPTPQAVAQWSPPAAAPQSQPPARAESAVRGGERGSYQEATVRRGDPEPTQAQVDADLICTGGGCAKALTKGQRDVSVRAYGQPLCPACQKRHRNGGTGGTTEPAPDDREHQNRRMFAAYSEACSEQGYESTEERMRLHCAVVLGRVTGHRVTVKSRADLTTEQLRICADWFSEKPIRELDEASDLDPQEDPFENA